MKVAIGQINPVIGDFSGNRSRMIRLAAEAKRGGADLLVLPEMSLCGYPPMDLLDYDSFVRENLKSLRELQRETPRGLAVAVGYIDRNRNNTGRPFSNVVSILLDGEILFTQEKTLLPSYDVFDETRYFEPARSRRVWAYRGERIGIAICEDIWWESEPAPGTRYPLDPVKDLLDAGASLILAPSASPFSHGKAEIRRRLVSGIGESSGVPVVYVNTVGGNDSLIFDGRSFVTDSAGRTIHVCRGFEEDFAVVDLSAPHSPVPLETEKYDSLERALVLGIRDYLSKCGFSRVHLGLSGGIDSALVAVLAARAAGPENVMGFALPSRYSSEGSKIDAQALADKLGIGYEVLPIEDVFAANLAALTPYFGGKEPDLTEENLQARIRGTLLMGYSNKWNSLLLTTGNKSELAPGYCTLYGDMCGGLAVIGDLFKTEVYDLCRFINRRAPLIPESILLKPPSAELRPNQTDQDSLPPYDLLDAILERYLVRNRSREELVEEGFDPKVVEDVIRLVGRSEYKRRQAPPVLKVSARAFGTGRRMPIARALFELA